MYTKVWVNDFIVPNESRIEGGKKPMNCFLKRC